MRHTTSALVVSCLTLLGGVTTTAQPAHAGMGFPIPLPGGDIAGIVLTGSDGTPAPAGMDVRLVVQGKLLAMTTTDSSGGFFFPGLRPGTYIVESGSSSRRVSLGSFSAFVRLSVK